MIDAFKKKGLNIKVSKEVVDKIINMCDYEKFGARRVDKVIDEVITTIIVDAWYNGKKEITV